MRVRRVVTPFALLYFITASLLATPVASSPQAEPLRLGIPAYFAPGHLWFQAINATPAVGILIMNPHNGPGSSRDPAYSSVSQTARGRGVLVFGYVHTNWAEGTVSLTHARNQIDQYYAWYGVDGIFLDEASDSCASAPLNYYTSLHNWTKLKSGHALVVLNPGKATEDCYSPISDIIVTFEGNHTEYLQMYNSSSSKRIDSSGQIWHIVFSVPSLGVMIDVLRLARERGASWIYVADGDKETAFHALPSYFLHETIGVDPLDAYGLRVGTPLITRDILFVMLAASIIPFFNRVLSDVQPGRMRVRRLVRILRGAS